MGMQTRQPGSPSWPARSARSLHRALVDFPSGGTSGPTTLPDAATTLQQSARHWDLKAPMWRSPVEGKIQGTAGQNLSVTYHHLARRRPATITMGAPTGRRHRRRRRQPLCGADARTTGWTWARPTPSTTVDHPAPTTGLANVLDRLLRPEIGGGREDDGNTVKVTGQSCRRGQQDRPAGPGDRPGAGHRLDRRTVTRQPGPGPAGTRHRQPDPDDLVGPQVAGHRRQARRCDGGSGAGPRSARAVWPSCSGPSTPTSWSRS